MFTALFGILAIGTTSFTNPDGLLRALAVTPSLTVKAADATSVTYTATLTPEAGFQLFPVTLFGGDQKARNDLAKQSTGDTARLTLVTDAEGRPTKVTYSVTGEGKPTTIATGYTGWGSGEPVAVPAEATVMEAAELDKQFTS
jgi:YD repeat-containing protein